MHLIHLLLALLLTSSALADSITLDAIPDRVRSNHPDLLAARLRITEAQARQLGSGRLANPSVGVEFQPESRVSPRTSSVALEQNFPVTHRLRLEKQLTTQLVAAAELEVRDVERRLIADAQSLAVQALALGQHLVIHQQQGTLAADLVAFTEARTKAGEISPLDAAQARVDARRLDLESRQLTAQQALLLSQLKPLIGLPASQSLTLSGKLPDPVLPAKRDWQSRPDFQLAQSHEQTAATETALAKSNRWQDLSAGLFAAREQQDVTGQGTQRTGFVGFRLSIPLPFWDRNQGQIAEKAAAAERARLETAALASHISHEAATARQDMASQLALVAETRDHLLPLIAEQTDALEKAYQAGQTDLLALLRAREQQLEAQTSLLDSLRDFHLARIRHETALGNPSQP
jgi:cobalt-zinc-cadmium efflux system outer membrane protein